MKTYEKTLILVPTYNEAGNISLLLAGVFKACPTIHVLLIDDGSKDKTVELAQKAFSEHGQGEILQRNQKLGLGTAYKAGFLHAVNCHYENVITMDADLSHDAAELPEMLQKLGEADYVIGSRYVAGGGTKNWSLFRRILSKGGSLYARMILMRPIRDFTGGFNAYKVSAIKELLDRHRVSSEGYAFQVEIKYRLAEMGKRWVEHPICFADRIYGQSKMSGKIALEAIWKIWKLKFS